MTINRPNNRIERGITTGLLLVVLAGVVAIAGLGTYFKYDFKKVSKTSNTEALALDGSSGNNISLASENKIVTDREVSTRPAYHNATYGLTIPGVYAVTPVAVSPYGGVSPVASYSFNYNGVYAFTINVFSKEEWNNIRIQETLSADAGTTNAYLGEGTYLGENKTWIFSVIPAAYTTPSGVYFY